MTFHLYLRRNTSDRPWGIARIPKRLPGSVNQRFFWLGPVFVLFQGDLA